MPTVYKYQDVIADLFGRPIPNVAITVKNHVGGTAAQLWNEAGTVPVVSNIVTSDTYGRFSFYAELGRYDLNSAYGNITDVVIYGVVTPFSSGLFIAEVNGDYTVGVSDRMVLVDASLGNVVITLQPAAAQTCDVLIKRVDSNTDYEVTILPTGAETLEGATEFKLQSQWASVTAHPDGTDNYLLT